MPLPLLVDTCWVFVSTFVFRLPSRVAHHTSILSDDSNADKHNTLPALACITIHRLQSFGQPYLEVSFTMLSLHLLPSPPWVLLSSLSRTYQRNHTMSVTTYSPSQYSYTWLGLSWDWGVQGRTYLCKKLDLGSKVAMVRAADLKYYTKTRDFTDVHVVGGHTAYPVRVSTWLKHNKSESLYLS